MKVYVASDHAGFELKQFLASALAERGFTVVDLGPKVYNHEDDYPDLIRPLAQALQKDKESLGVAAGLSGEGEAMELNRHKGVRAALYNGGPMDILRLAREHNNANALSLGSKFLSKDEALAAAVVWLRAPFLFDERHVRRIKKLDE